MRYVDESVRVDRYRLALYAASISAYVGPPVELGASGDGVDPIGVVTPLVCGTSPVLIRGSATQVRETPAKIFLPVCVT